MMDIKQPIPEIKVSSSTVLCSIECFSPNGQKQTRREWIKNHELYAGMTTLGERVVTPVTILGDPQKNIFAMDAVTGSLYEPKSGRCLTSSNLKLIGVYKKPGLDKVLMKIKGESWS